jgi:single-strand DNA-binding protein
MANNTNSITVVGNLTRDPEMRYTASGISTATFGVAVNRSWRNQQTNEWEERTSFFNIVCWRQLADNVAASLKKGMRVVATGRLEQRSWETDQGEKRSVVEIVADEVGPSLVFATADVHRVERSGPGDGAPARGPQPAPAPVPATDYGEYGEEPF